MFILETPYINETSSLVLRVPKSIGVTTNQAFPTLGRTFRIERLFNSDCTRRDPVRKI